MCGKPSALRSCSQLPWSAVKTGVAAITSPVKVNATHMLYDFFIKWGGWAASAGFGLAFMTMALVTAIQPRNTSKWFFMSFSFVILCIGVLCMLEGWQHLQKGDSKTAQTLFLSGGGWFFAFMLMLGFSLSRAKEQLPQGETPGRDSCTRHARWLSISYLAGIALTFLASFFSAECGMPQQGAVLILLLSYLAFCGASYIIFVFGLPPRCRSCKSGRMRLKGSLPAWYRCQSCGVIIHTHIMLGRKSI